MSTFNIPLFYRRLKRYPVINHQWLELVLNKVHALRDVQAIEVLFYNILVILVTVANSE